MPLFISLTTDQGTRHTCTTKSTSIPIRYDQIGDVKYIQVTGEEIEHLKSMWTVAPVQGIPRPHPEKGIYLYGDVAKTIVANFFNTLVQRRRDD